MKDLKLKSDGMENEPEKIIQTIKEMIALVMVIQEQSSDNPKLSKSILGKSIVNRANQIHQQLKDQQNGRR